MGRITSKVWTIISMFKYHIVVVLGIAIVCFLDENSIMKYMKYKYQIEELKTEIDKYRQRYNRDVKLYNTIDKDPAVMSKIARERYFMKNDDEDIFVLSDDEMQSEKIDAYEKVEQD